MTMEGILLKDRSVEELCRELSELVKRTEITKLKIVPGVIYYKPAPEIPPTGDGPILKLIDIIKEVCKKYCVVEIEVNERINFKAHILLEFDIWKIRTGGDEDV